MIITNLTANLLILVIASSVFAAKPATSPEGSVPPVTTPKNAERVYAPIQLPKNGFIHLDVLDAHNQRRTFLVTCEKTLDAKITDALRHIGAGYHPLKKGQKQSLINHWQIPATDYVISCEGN